MINLKNLTPTVQAQLQGINAQDVGASAHVARVIADTVAQADVHVVPGANPYVGAAALAKHLADTGAIKDLAGSAVMLEASQRLSRAAAEYGAFMARVEQAFGGAAVGGVDKAQVARVAGFVAGPGGDLAATLAAPLHHQTWLATTSTWAVDLTANPGALKPGMEGRSKVGKDGLQTAYDVAGRSGLIDFNVARDEARAAQGEGGKQLYRQLLDDGRRGTLAAQQAVVHYFEKGAIPSPQNARLAAQTLSNPAEAKVPGLLLDKGAKAAIKAMGRELSQALQAFDTARPGADQAKVLWEQFPNARGLAETEQLFWLQYDLSKGEGQKTGKQARKFADLSPENQIQNVRSTVVGLLGLLEADDLLRGIISGERKLTPELGELLQAHLDQASQQAIQIGNGQGDYALASSVHARAVATQQLVQVLAFAKEGFGISYTEDQATKIFSTLFRAAKESGDVYGQEGASAASKVGVKYVGELMTALFPGKKGDLAAFGHGLIADQSFQVMADLMGKIGTPWNGDGQGLKEAIGRDYKDNWGIEDILKIPGNGRKYSNEELFGYYGVMTMLNNTWASQQAGRAIEETAAGKDDSRVLSDKRGGVYQPYLFMLKGLNNTVETGLRIAQDAMEAGKKAGTLDRPE